MKNLVFLPIAGLVYVLYLVDVWSTYKNGDLYQLFKKIHKNDPTTDSLPTRTKDTTVATWGDGKSACNNNSFGSMVHVRLSKPDQAWDYSYWHNTSIDNETYNNPGKHLHWNIVRLDFFRLFESI